MSLISTINTLPVEAQRSVLFSLVGSLNASIIYACHAQSRKDSYKAIKISRGYETQENAKAVKEQFTHTIDDFNDEMNTKGYMHKADGSTDFDKQEPELGPDEVVIPQPIERAYQLHPLREYFLDKLISVSTKAPKLSYTESFEFNSQRPQKQIAEELLIELAEMGDVDIEDMKTIFSIKHKISQNELRSAHDDIFRYIETLNGVAEDDDQAEELISNLSSTMQVKLIEKTQAAIKKAKLDTLFRLANGDARVDLGDLPILKAAKVELDELDNELQVA